MELILAVIIVVGVLAFIAYPLFNTPSEERTENPAGLDGLLSQRDAAYDAIRDLDFDFQMGKLSESDYATMRERYKGRAAVALEQIDASSRASGALAEEQIAALRAAKRAAPVPDDAIEREIAQRRARKATAVDLDCPNCGTPYKAGDAFCAKCGTSLTAKQTNR